MTPYLTFNGNCEAAFKFYMDKLGAKLVEMHRFAGSPMADQAPPEHQKKIMHAHLKLHQQELMGSDGMPGQLWEGYKGFSLALSAHSVEEAERWFAGLSEGGTVQMPMAKTFWAERFGMLTDQFGITWAVNFENRPIH